MSRPLTWPSSGWFLREQEHNCNWNVSESLHSITNHIISQWRCPHEWPKHVCLPQYDKSSPKKLKCVCWSLVYCIQIHSFSAPDMGFILSDFLRYKSPIKIKKKKCFSETLQPCKIRDVAGPPIHSLSAQHTEGKHEHRHNKQILC